MIDASRVVFNFTSAPSHRLDVFGMVPLTDTLVIYTARVLFHVLRNLGVNILLCRTCKDRHVQSIKNIKFHNASFLFLIPTSCNNSNPIRNL